MNLSVLTPLDELTAFLRQKSWIQPNDQVIENTIPGAGNMNVVIRVKTNHQSLILKQSLPYVQKYPQIPAPIERIAVEHQFYQLTNVFLKTQMPQLIGFDAENHLLCLEDLGEGSDYTFIYKRQENISKTELFEAVDTLSLLHRYTFEIKDSTNFPDNLALRKLNHEHVFMYPFMIENGFDLDTIQPGLQALAMHYKTDDLLKTELLKLGDIYLSRGETLIHGDYYPGSWLKTAAGLRVIDPEFCFFGMAEYDLGVLLAHLKMAQTSDVLIQDCLNRYQKPINIKLTNQFIAIEIFRRIIGLAQLPLALTLAEKENLLIFANSQFIL